MKKCVLILAKVFTLSPFLSLVFCPQALNLFVKCNFLTSEAGEVQHRTPVPIFSVTHCKHAAARWLLFPSSTFNARRTISGGRRRDLCGYLIVIYWFANISEKERSSLEKQPTCSI